MNEPETLNPALLKSLFAQLVRACGKQDAAAARLGISRQRVGQLCSANPEHARDIPTWDQVWALEAACGRSVVFRALADLVEPDAAPRDACPVKETHDVVQAAASMLSLADDLKAGKPGAHVAFMDGLNRLQREADECEASAIVTPLRAV